MKPAAPVTTTFTGGASPGRLDEGPHGGLRVAAGERGGTRHDDLRARLDDGADVAGVHAAVHLDRDGRPRARIASRKSPDLVEAGGSSFCPAKPGLTDMTSTKSTSGRISSRAPRGVDGLSATPGRTPRLRRWSTARCRWGSASTWTLIEDAPASTKASR